MSNPATTSAAAASAPDDTKPKELQHRILVGPGGAKAFRVKRIRTWGPGSSPGPKMELPNKPASDNVGDDSLRGDGQPAQTNIPRYQLYLLPWLQAVAVFFFRPSQFEPTGAPILIPVSWVQVELAE